MSARALVVCAVLAVCAPARAQATSVLGRVVFVGATPWTVIERWDARGASLELRGRSGSTVGPLPAAGWLAAAARDDGVLIAVAASGPPSVRAVWIPVAGGRAGTPRPITIPRVGGQSFAPVGVSIAARPDGYDVLWQEGSTASAMETWRTYEARLDPRGDPIGAPRELPRVPWPIADALYANGRTFLLLYYGASAPERTRLAAVWMNDSGAPEQHPWWASREGMIGEAHLIAAGDRVLAIYRGGRDGDALLEADVTQGGWGREVSAPREHGAIDPLEAYGAEVEPSGLRIERARLRD